MTSCGVFPTSCGIFPSGDFRPCSLRKATTLIPGVAPVIMCSGFYSYFVSFLLLSVFISITWVFQRTHYWTPKIQDGWYPPSWQSTWRHFFCWGWSDLDNISQTGAEWHVDCTLRRGLNFLAIFLHHHVLVADCKCIYCIHPETQICSTYISLTHYTVICNL